MPKDIPTATDRFAGREAAYNDNLGQVIGRFCTAIVEADSAAKDAHTRRVLGLVKAGNVEFVAQTSLIGSDTPMQTRVSVPVMSVTDMKPAEIKEATLDLDMTVSMSDVDTYHDSFKAGGKGTGKVGWGPFSVSIQVSAQMSSGKEQKRSSDYRSHTHAHVEMGQGDTPEGLSLIIDALNQNTSKTLELNQAIVQARMSQIAQEGVDAGDAKLPEPDSNTPPALEGGEPASSDDKDSAPAGGGE